MNEKQKPVVKQVTVRHFEDRKGAYITHIDYEPILSHHTAGHSSDISIQHNCSPQAIGMRF